MPREFNVTTYREAFREMPRWIKIAMVFAILSTLVPLALVWYVRARNRFMGREKTRVHLFLDMDQQPRLKAQGTVDRDMFADGRAMRLPVPGTVARGSLTPGTAQQQDHFLLGYRTDDTGQPVMQQTDAGEEFAWYTGFPPQVEVTEQLLERGKWKYEAYCATCHGYTGEGDGMVPKAAERLGQLWQVTSLQNTLDGRLQYAEPLYPNGKMYHTIAQGQNTMPGYADQIKPHDRWAIVAYVHALQLSQNPQLMQQAMEEVAEARRKAASSDLAQHDNLHDRTQANPQHNTGNIE